MYARAGGLLWLFVVGVDQGLTHGAVKSAAPGGFRSIRVASEPQCVEPVASFEIGDGHEEEPASLVRCAETATWKIDSPEGDRASDPPSSPSNDSARG